METGELAIDEQGELIVNREMFAGLKINAISKITGVNDSELYYFILVDK